MTPTARTSVAGRAIALLVLAVVAAAAYVVLPVGLVAEAVRVVAPALAAAAVLLGVSRLRPDANLGWSLLAVALGVLAAAHLVFARLDATGDRSFPSLADGFHLVAAVGVLVAVLILCRHAPRDHDRFGWFEGVIVAIAAGTGVWLVVVEPFLSDGDVDVAQTVWALAVPIPGAIAFAAAFRLAARSAFRAFAPCVLTVGVGLLATADALRGLAELRGEFGRGGWVAAIGVAAPLVMAASAHDPSMTVRHRRFQAPGTVSAARTIGLSVAVLTPLTIVLVLAIGDLGTSTTRLVVAAAASASVVLALARMWGLLAAVRVLTERRGQDRLAAMVEHSSDVVMLVDDAGDIRYASPGLTSSLGHRDSDWLGRPLVDLIAAEDRDAAGVELERVIDLGPDATVKFESSLVRVDGQRRRMEATIANLIGGDAVDGIVATFRDVTEQRDLERQLSHRAFHDELTGLANRALFLDRMDHALRVSRADSDPVVVLFVDLDDFKSVNDALGHGVGDQLLRAIAERIRIVAGSGDTPARLGGDEFALLLEDRGGVDRAIGVAEALLDQLRHPVQLAGYDLSVLASVGVAVAAPGMTTSSLLRDADIAMYEAKRAGKGQIKIFDPAMRLGATTQLEFRSELATALEHDEFRLVFQPLVSLHSGEVTGAEALLRWRHPHRGEVSPSEFIPVAERSGLIGDIGSWVLNEALAEAHRWQVRGPRQVSINVSAVQLRSDGFVERVAEALHRTSLPSDRVTLEITETLLVEEVERASTVLDSLRALGVRIAIDDFGTGYCSLSYLRRFPVDVLKIDRQFIDEVDADARRSSLARMILQMTDTLGIASVAEGIERPSQLAVLRRLGCDVGQGYLLSRPLELDVLRPRFGLATPVDASAYAAVDG